MSYKSYNNNDIQFSVWDFHIRWSWSRLCLKMYILSILEFTSLYTLTLFWDVYCLFLLAHYGHLFLPSYYWQPRTQAQGITALARVSARGCLGRTRRMNLPHSFFERDITYNSFLRIDGKYWKTLFTQIYSKSHTSTW